MGLREPGRIGGRQNPSICPMSSAKMLKNLLEHLKKIFLIIE